MEPDNSTIDPQVQTFTKAIAMQEGGGSYASYDAPSGDDGSMPSSSTNPGGGRYQYIPATWKNYAQQTLGDASAPMTPDNQNKVTYSTLEKWKQEGKTWAQMASMWNAGQGGADYYKTNPKVADYVANVQKYAQQLESQPSLGQSVLNAPTQIGSEIAKGGKPAIAGATGAAAVGAGLGLAALPEEALSGAEGLLGEAGNAVKGGLADIGLGNLFGNNNQTPTSTGVSQSSVQPEPSLPEPGTTKTPQQTELNTVKAPTENQPPLPKEPQFETSENNSQVQQMPLYNTLGSMLGSTIGGSKVLNEQKGKKVDVIARMIRDGTVPQPDEEGNLKKEHSVLRSRQLINEDSKSIEKAAESSNSPTNIGDLEQATIKEAEHRMKNSPELARVKREIHRKFNDIRAEQPKLKDKNGKEYHRKFLHHKDLNQMRKRIQFSKNDWNRPAHERDADQHLYSALRKRQSELAKQDGIKGFDETMKRMEERILTMKAIEKLPKKAARDKWKEFRKDLIAGLAGGLIGKTLGNGILGGTAGYLLEQRLGKKEYKKLGSKHERGLLEKRKQIPQKGLISIASNHAKAK